MSAAEVCLSVLVVYLYIGLRVALRRIADLRARLDVIDEAHETDRWRQRV